MRVGVVGAGRIGAGTGLRLGRKGHEVMFSFSRDPAKLEALAGSVANGRAGTPREAVEFADALVLSVPWRAIEEALEQMGPLAGKVVIDTTNQFGAAPGEIPDGLSAVEVNARRMPGAAPAKAFNTLTAAYQREVAEGGPGEVAMFFAAEDARATEVVANAIGDCGFVPVRIGGWAQVGLMEAPRRPGAVYGEAYAPADAERIAAAARAGDLETAARLAEELAIEERGG